MSDDVEFVEPTPPPRPRLDAAKHEEDMYSAEPTAPNCFYLPIGKKGYISWQSDNHIAVLALVMFVVLLASIAVLTLLSLIPGAPEWISEVTKVFGQALLLVVGAIFGAGASANNKN